MLASECVNLTLPIIQSFEKEIISCLVAKLGHRQNEWSLLPMGQRGARIKQNLLFTSARHEC